MEKLTMHSPDLTERNIDRIAELFPTVVTEQRYDDGNLVRAVDFDLLRQELSDHVVDGPRERYQLDWPGKRASLFAANAPVSTTLRPDREASQSFDSTENVFIEGDNLEVLKLLQESYLAAVQMIYIDPPYNTGNDLVYADDFRMSRDEYLHSTSQATENRERLTANTEANGRFHSDWLNMMYARLKLARNLLAPSGVIFISIDEHEVGPLLCVCEEIFGSRNVLGAMPVVMNLKGNQDAFGFAETHEFVVVCFRDIGRAQMNPLPIDEERARSEWSEDEYGLYKEADNLRATGVNAPRSKRPNLWYPIFVDVEQRYAYATDSNRPTDPDHETLWPINPDGEELSWYWSKQKLAENPHNLVAKHTTNGYQLYKKQRPSLGDYPTKKPKSVLFDSAYSTSTATKQLKDLMGGRFFSAPKPVPFLKDLIAIGSTPDSLILDFFAGSGSLAQAVMEVNGDDGGRRRYIAVQVGEHFEEDGAAARAGYESIPEFARERICRAGRQVKERTHAAEIDHGFRALKIDTSNFADVFISPDEASQDQLGLVTDSIVPGRSPEDLLFEVLLRWGLPLSLPIVRTSLEEFDVFSVDDDAVLACFDTDLTDRAIESLAKRRPLRMVFHEAGFTSDAARINAGQLFAEISPATDVKVI